jgi:hypothetical protein
MQSTAMQQPNTHIEPFNLASVKQCTPLHTHQQWVRTQGDIRLDSGVPLSFNVARSLKKKLQLLQSSSVSSA